MRGGDGSGGEYPGGFAEVLAGFSGVSCTSGVPRESGSLTGLLKALEGAWGSVDAVSHWLWGRGPQMRQLLPSWTVHVHLGGSGASMASRSLNAGSTWTVGRGSIVIGLRKCSWPVHRIGDPVGSVGYDFLRNADVLGV